MSSSERIRENAARLMCAALSNSNSGLGDVKIKDVREEFVKSIVDLATDLENELFSREMNNV